MKPVFQLRPFGAWVPSRPVSLYLAPSNSRHPVNVSPGTGGTAILAAAVFAGAAFAGTALAGAVLAGVFAGPLVCAAVLTCTVTNRIANTAAAVMLRVISQSSSF